MITKDQLQKIFPNADMETWFNPIVSSMEEFGINNLSRVSCFLAQIAHESGGLKYVRELASGDAYEGRSDLGNTQPGDGPMFKGRGLIQITGRHNYAMCSSALGVDFISSPELLEQPIWAVRSAAWFWNSHNLNEIADSGDFKKVTKVINGGYNGLDNRLRWWKRITEVLTGAKTEQPPAPVEDKDMPIPAIISAVATAAIPTLISKLPELAGILLDKNKDVKERNVEAAIKVLEAAKEVTGAVSHQEAIEKLSTPEVVNALRDKVKDQWYEIREIGGGAEGARAADIERAKTGHRFWLSGAFWVTFLLMPILYGIVWALLFEDSGLPNDTRAAIISLMAGTTIGAIAGYWFGSSFGSQRKDEIKEPTAAK